MSKFFATAAASKGVPSEKLTPLLARAGAEVTEEQLREYCRGRIAHYKVPRYVRFVDEFPMTVTGKVQKFVLRQRLQDDGVAGSAGDRPAP